MIDDEIRNYLAEVKKNSPVSEDKKTAELKLLSSLVLHMEEYLYGGIRSILPENHHLIDPTLRSNGTGLVYVSINIKSDEELNPLSPVEGDVQEVCQKYRRVLDGQGIDCIKEFNIVIHD